MAYTSGPRLTSQDKTHGLVLLDACPAPPPSIDRSALAKKQKDDQSRPAFQTRISIHHGSNDPTRGGGPGVYLSGSAVLFLKFSDASRSIDDFLLPCIKWVTVRTNLYVEILSKS
jgi:hypothetical protein